MKKIRKTNISGDFSPRFEHSEKPFYMPQFHFHDTYEIYILEKGELNFLIDNNCSSIKANDIILISPNVPHKVYSETSYSGICFHFSEYYLDTYFTFKTKQQLVKIFCNKILSLDKKYVSQLHTMAKIASAYPEYKHFQLANMLSLININAVSVENISEPAPKTKILQIIDYIKENYIIIQDLTALCDIFDISESYFCRLFKKTTGVTPIYYINHLKIDYSCIHLRKSKRPLSVIAHMCGFNSESYFIRTFKSHMHCTPTEYRQNLK